MKQKKRKKPKLGLLIFTIIIVGTALFFSNKYSVKIAHMFQIERNNFDKTELKWVNELNLKQAYNTCSSYSSMAYLYTQTGVIYDPEQINKEITWKMENNYSYPWGIIEYLEKQTISSNIYWHGLLSDVGREKWIKTKITKGKPVILVTGNQDDLHYVTILGFYNNVFYVYDSLLDKDKNGEDSGNINIHKNELFKRWRMAKFKSIPINIAITK